MRTRTRAKKPNGRLLRSFDYLSNKGQSIMTKRIKKAKK